jgi:hypothetical protein
MALISVDGIYKDGRVELAERPEGVEGPARVIVTFLPANKPETGLPDEQAPSDLDQAGKLPPRKGGIWRGKVWIADDFDTLPDDIAEAFGMGPG